MNYDVATARPLLARTPAVLRAWLEGLPPAWLDAPEGEGRWSPREVACHIADLEQDAWLGRARAILEHGVDRALPGVDRERFRTRYADAPLSSVLDEFAAARVRNLEALDGLVPSLDRLEAEGLHPQLGRVRLSQLLATWVAHDLTHLAQISRALAAQYRDAVGPWRAFLSVLRLPDGPPGAGQGIGRPEVDGVLAAIGETSLVPLRRIPSPHGAAILVKLEWENPTGSVKDRMARAVIERAESDGRLKPGGTVVEYTGGSTGTSLALVCAAKGYRLRIVSSDAFAREKLDQMRALGAELTLVESEGGQTTKKLILDMIEAARVMSGGPGTYWTDQLNNLDSIDGYRGLGEEIWRQTGGRVDAFVHCVGTSACIRGVATALKARNPHVRIVAVEPAESPVLSGGQPGPHKIEGVGIGYTPPLWDPAVVDEVVAVSTADARAMARRLAREEGLFAGTSSGANVVAALRVAAGLGPDARVVTLMADSGLKYTSTDVYRL